MKKIVPLVVLVFVLFGFVNQKSKAFQDGEWIKFRIHYGLINAGYATLELNEEIKNNKKVFHAKGKGYTAGMSRFFFKVDDTYESYFDKESGKPYQSIRKISEGGYTKNQESFFNQASNKILLKDYKSSTEKSFSVTENIQDVISAFYYLRNHPDVDKLKIGESIAIDMFFDDEVINFKLKYLGKEDIKTKFGTTTTLIFRPLVQSGRVFKEEESLTIWITADENKIPVRIKADLAIGSLKADIESFKGLKSTFIVKPKK